MQLHCGVGIIAHILPILQIRKLGLSEVSALLKSHNLQEQNEVSGQGLLLMQWLFRN